MIHNANKTGLMFHYNLNRNEAHVDFPEH
jgi:hypothetical protein